MPKHWKLITALFSVLATTAVACSSGNGATETTTPQTTRTTTTTVAATTTLLDSTTTTVPPIVRADADLVIWADETRAPAITPFAEAFAAENGLTFAVQELGFGDIRGRLLVTDPTGEGPDVIIGAHDWLDALVASNVVAPIDVSEIAGDLAKVAVDAFTYGGETYGVPYSMENVALIRNVDLVPAPPATFEELEVIALGLVAEGTVTVPLAIQENGSGDPLHNYPLVTALGGYVFGSPETGYDASDVGIDSPGGLAAARAFDGWAESGLIDVDVTYQHMVDSFSTGQAPFAITGPWAMANFADVNYVVEPIPPVQGGTPRPFISAQGFMVAAGARNSDMVETFLLQVMAGVDAQTAMFEAGNRPPANTAAFAQASDDPDIQGFGLSGANGLPLPAIPEMDLVWSAWTSGYQRILTGQADPVQAFEDAAGQIRALIAG